MKIIKKLILGASFAETWLLCLRNLCWALQKVDKHEALEAEKKCECWFTGRDFPHFVIPRNFPTIPFTLLFSKLEKFFNQNEFHFSVIFCPFTRKKNWKDGGWEGEGRKKPETFNVTLQKMPENFVSLEAEARKAQWGKFIRHSQPQTREQREARQKKSNKHIMAFIAMYTYTWKVFVCFHPDKRFIFPLPRPFASPLQFHSRYCLSAMACVLLLMFQNSGEKSLTQKMENILCAQ